MLSPERLWAFRVTVDGMIARQHNARFIAGPPLQDDAVDSLVEQARSSVDPFAAVMLYEKALDARPDDTCIMGDAAELMLQLGRTEQAKQVRVSTLADRRDMQSMYRGGLKRVFVAGCQRHITCFIRIKLLCCLKDEKYDFMFPRTLVPYAVPVVPRLKQGFS